MEASWWSLYLQKYEEGKPEKSFGKRREYPVNKREKRSSGGSSGKPNVSLARTGTRDRRFPIATTKMARPTIVKAKYFAKDKWTNKRISQWLSYCVSQRSKDKERQTEKTASKADHEREPSEKQMQLLQPEQNNPAYLERDPFFFDAERDGITKDEAVKTMVASVGKKVSHHTLVLSPGASNLDLKEYARTQMLTLEESLGHKLTWVGNINRDTGPDKEHIHITIAGAIPNFKPRQRDVQQELKLRGYDSDEIDHARLADDAKLTRDGTVYTKHHSSLELRSLDNELRTSRQYLSKDDYKRLWSWIGTKEKYGELAYGMPPLKDPEREIDYRMVSDEDKFEANGRFFSKFDRSKDLKALEEYSQADFRNRLGDENERKLQTWIARKNRDGESCYGSPPTIKKDKEERLESTNKQQATFEVDFDKIKDIDKVQDSDRTITKFSSRQDIKDALERRREDSQTIEKLKEWLKSSADDSFRIEDRIRVDDQFVGPKSSKSKIGDALQQMSQQRTDIAKLQGWYHNKVQFGDDYYGQPPLLQPERSLDDNESSITRSTDELARELTGGEVRSVQAVNVDRALNRYDRIRSAIESQDKLQRSANNRGDVYISKSALKAMRQHGDYYVHTHKNLQREIDKEIERQEPERDPADRGTKAREGASRILETGIERDTALTQNERSKKDGNREPTLSQPESPSKVQADSSRIQQTLDSAKEIIRHTRTKRDSDDAQRNR